MCPSQDVLLGVDLHAHRGQFHQILPMPIHLLESEPEPNPELLQYLRHEGNQLRT